MNGDDTDGDSVDSTARFVACVPGLAFDRVTTAEMYLMVEYRQARHSGLLPGGRAVDIGVRQFDDICELLIERRPDPANCNHPSACERHRRATILAICEMCFGLHARYSGNPLEMLKHTLYIAIHQLLVSLPIMQSILVEVGWDGTVSEDMHGLAHRFAHRYFGDVTLFLSRRNRINIWPDLEADQIYPSSFIDDYFYKMLSMVEPLLKQSFDLMVQFSHVRSYPGWVTPNLIPCDFDTEWHGRVSEEGSFVFIPHVQCLPPPIDMDEFDDEGEPRVLVGFGDSESEEFVMINARKQVEGIVEDCSDVVHLVANIDE